MMYGSIKFWRGGKKGECRKVEVEKKRWILAQPSYSLQGNGRQGPRVETMGIDHLMQRITQELSKAGRTSETTATFEIYMFKTRIT